MQDKNATINMAQDRNLETSWGKEKHFSLFIEFDNCEIENGTDQVIETKESEEINPWIILNLEFTCKNKGDTSKHLMYVQWITPLKI